MTRLTKRIVDAALPSEREHFVWCGGTPGFGVRVYPSGRKVFVAQVRVGHGTRRLKIGQYGPFTVDQARSEAEEIIRAAARGRDPQRERRETKEALTVSELLDRYMEAARAGLVITRFGIPKRQSTVAVDEGRVTRHIKPLIGTLVARDVTRADIQNMADQIAEGRTRGVHKSKPRGKAVVTGGAGTAARAVELLGGVFNWAEKRGLVNGPSPVRNIDRVRPKPRDRYLSTAELTALGRVLQSEVTNSPKAVGAVWLIALTGLRREEACGLRWSEIDVAGQCLRLSETKTGKSVRPIGQEVVRLLQSLPRDSGTWVFPNDKDVGKADLKKEIAAIFNAAGLDDARSHDLRRTFASVAADEGYSDATIAALLGHAQRSVTARHYIRRPDAALVAAADRTAARIQSTMMGTVAEVVELPGRFAGIPAR
ncbi:MAG TPA: site-specific integrase [Rhizomicrobium sp.]|nr:site-specific integrase [Rhizomicrobium sp.]